MFSRFLQRSSGKSRGTAKAGVGLRRRRNRLLVEALEDRLALSVFNVNSTADLLDPPDGVVTLRSAIEMANQIPGNNTINLTVPGTYKIAIPGAGLNDNTAGEFAIVANAASPTGSTLTIQNRSGGKVIVDGNHLARVFDINPEDVVTPVPFTVVMQGFTIQNGVAQPGAAAEGSGGGIRDQGNVNLTLTSMTITDNSATGNGGGIAVDGTRTSISNTAIDGNISGGSGGAVFANGVTLTIQSSTLAGNTSSGDGGGVELETTGAGLLQGSTISNTTITGNRVLNHAGADGGGIDASTAFTGELLLLHDTINANFADVGGGVFWAATLGSAFSLQNTIIAGNFALFGSDVASDASSLLFTAELDGAQQVPSNASPVTGHAAVLLSPDQTTLRLGTTFVVLESPSTAVGTISGNNGYIDSGYGEPEVNISGTVNSAPASTPSTTSLNLGTTTAGTAGTVQSYTVSGSNLTAAITISAPPGVELSSDNGDTYHPSLTLTSASGMVATTTIQARISPSAGVGTIRGRIRYTSPGASEQEMNVSGTVNSAPAIKPSTTSLDLGTAGAAQSYMVSSNLTAAIIVTTPVGVELSSDNGSTLHQSLALTPANGTAATDADGADIALANLPQDGGMGDRSAPLPVIITEVILAIAIRANAGPALPDSKSGPRTGGQADNELAAGARAVAASRDRPAV